MEDNERQVRIVYNDGTEEVIGAVKDRPWNAACLARTFWNKPEALRRIGGDATPTYTRAPLALLIGVDDSQKLIDLNNVRTLQRLSE